MKERELERRETGELNLCIKAHLVKRHVSLGLCVTQSYQWHLQPVRLSQLRIRQSWLLLLHSLSCIYNL